MRVRGGVRRGFSRLSDRLGGVANIPALATFVGTQSVTTAFTFTAVADGPHTFWAWSAGAVSATSAGGWSGSFSRKTVNLSVGDQVSITIGKNRSGSTAGEPTTVTLAGIISIVCAPGSLSAVAATGGDVNLPGVAPPSGSNGAAAPGDAYFPGGIGGTTNKDAQWPGAGGYSGRPSGTGGVVVAYAKEAPL